jgi:predicted TIM-barrel fold metal-dependent hydrolase
MMTPWLDVLHEHIGGFELFDAHTHIGANDPDGFKQTPEELLEHLAAADARATVFPMHELAGYEQANDEVLAAASASGGRLVAFCRVDPHRDPLPEAHRALGAGARGIKLHPRAEGFTMRHPAVRELIGLAHERSLPVLIHAGRGIPALGRHTVELAEAFPNARLILAHAAISDLAWLWRVPPSHPNVFVDTSWWNATDLLALFALAPPGQVLWASDSPYGSPVQGAIVSLRCGLEVGLTPEQVRMVAGGQMQRLLNGEEPADLGPAPGQSRIRHDVLLGRVADNLVSALGRRVVGDDGDEPVALARLGCAVGDDAPQASACRSILELIDRSERHRALPESDRRPFSDLHLIACALSVARAPSAPLPDPTGEPHAEREAIDP